MQRIKNNPTYKENVELSKVEYFLGSDLQPMADDAIARAQLHVALSDSISLLGEREQLVLRAFYGIGAPQMTFDEIGKAYGMTRERARQIRNKALRHLRSKAKSLAER
ncbi:MAG: hypothetical protein NC344_07820 [Bacteroidales bacterium]|nr:hypothetical protein [Bacteroidales bacterium]MCM1147721.1 hypothetical protein [Bacteroidales bacterium]MCM1206669.1 hypothetical protein [Bacillota bacterium]MCM1510590.1 hypothetical protein [Clostridium sp.]